MNRVRAALLALFLASPAFAGSLSISQFGGLNTDDSPLTLTHGQTPDSENVVTDDGPSLQGRRGFLSYSTEPATALWEFPTAAGTRYLICRSGNTLKATTGGSFTITISTVASNAQTVGTPLGDRFYFANTVDGLKYWDTTKVVVASATLTVDKLVTFKGRLVAAGKAGSERTMYLSKYLDGATWTTPANPGDDDPTQLTVSGALDEGLQALYPSFQDKLMWFKTSSFGAIFGSRRSNFTSRVYSDRVGIAAKESLQDCDGVLRWLSSNREIYGFDGNSFAKLSEDVDTMFADVAQGNSASRSLTFTSQADWDGGTKSGALVTNDPAGDLAFEPWGLIDAFADGNFTSNPTWTQDAGSWSVVSGALHNTGNTQSISTPLTTNAVGAWSFSVKASTVTGDWSVNFVCGPWVSTASAYSYAYQVHYQASNVLQLNRVDYFSHSTFISSATITPSAATQSFRVVRTSAGSFSVYVNGIQQLSATDTTYSSSTFVSAQTGFGTGTFAYDFDDFYYGSDPAASSTVSASTTATYTTSLIPVGLNSSSWGPVTITNTLVNSTITYEMGSSASASTTTISNWTSISNLATPSIATNTYAAFRATFNMVGSTNTAKLSDITATWVDGSTLTVASGYVNRRYWLACAVGSTSNNRIFVYDKNGQWQRYTGMNATAMSRYGSTQLFGNSAGIFKAETGYSDNGSSIASYFRSPSYAPAGTDAFAKYRRIFLTTAKCDSSIGTTYRINAGGSDLSLATVAMNVTDGIQNVDLPFPTAQAQQGKFIDFKWSVTGTNFWRLLNANLYYDADSTNE